MNARTLLRNRILNHRRVMTSPQGEPGQAALLVALMLVGLLAFAGLVFDGGTAYAQRRLSQNAADSAAYAGARVVASAWATGNPGNWGRAGDCAVLYAVDSYAKANGITGSTLTSSCGGSASPNLKAYYVIAGTGDTVVVGNGFIPFDVAAISVTVKTTFNTLFLRVVNTQIGQVAAAAEARFGFPVNAQVIPLTIDIATLQRGGACDPGANPPKLCQLQGQTTAPGNFQWLDLNQKTNSKCSNPSVPDLRGWLTPPPNTAPSPPVNAGDNICGTPGKNGNSFNTEKAAWLAMPESNRLWIIPVYDTVNLQGNTARYHIVGFATFILHSWGNGDIQAYFQSWVFPGQNQGNGWCPGGTCSVNLSR